MLAPSDTIPIAEIEHDHEVQEALCHELEALADALPRLPSPAYVRKLAERIDRIVTEHFIRAERFFLALSQWERPSKKEFRRLRAMHMLDALHAEDMIEMLWDRVCERPALSQTDLGYMLRCFFDGCRRAVAYKEVLMARIGRVNRGLRSLPAGRDPEPYRSGRLSPSLSHRLFAAGSAGG